MRLLAGLIGVAFLASVVGCACQSREVSMVRDLQNEGLAVFKMHDGKLMAVPPEKIDSIIQPLAVIPDWCCLSYGFCQNIQCNERQLPPDCASCFYTASQCEQACTPE